MRYSGSVLNVGGLVVVLFNLSLRVPFLVPFLFCKKKKHIVCVCVGERSSELVVEKWAA